mmetsp:Transcript_308/g.562  ORF Transcript_308/g.562 Transcript_308/m.562 type:complete len:742 (+) Transcript_308:32-2257(+)
MTWIIRKARQGCQRIPITTTTRRRMIEKQHITIQKYNKLIIPTNYKQATYIGERALKQKKKRIEVILKKKHLEPIKWAKNRRIIVEGPMTIVKWAEVMGARVFDIMRLLPPGYEKFDVLPVSVMRQFSKKFRCHILYSVDDPEARIQHQLENREPIKKKLKKGAKTPVVTIMGHVDHGKTTLLDYIRKTNVADKEAGAITQHIGAFKFRTGKKKTDPTITFIDTPGHFAFNNMRKAGASVTDVIVLMVAADDGVKPQTLESIQLAREADVPMIVAINKIDKDNAIPLPEITTELMKHGVIPDDQGGDDIFVPISAKKGTNVNKIMEAILLVNEMNEREVILSPDYTQLRASIIECKMIRGVGMTATIIINSGVLERGTSIMANNLSCRVKKITDDTGKVLKEAYPGDVVEVVGFDSMPKVGAPVYGVHSVDEANSLITKICDFTENKAAEQAAREFYMSKREEARNQGFIEDETPDEEETLEFEEGHREVTVLLKFDVEGSLEAFNKILEDLPRMPNLSVRLVNPSIGDLTEADIATAKMHQAEILGMNIQAQKRLIKKAAVDSVKVSNFKVIYHLIDHLYSQINALLPKRHSEKRLGHAKVLKVFEFTGKQKDNFQVAGSSMEEGSMVCDRGYSGDGAIFCRIKRQGEFLINPRMKTLVHETDSSKLKGFDLVLAKTPDAFQIQSLYHLKNEVNRVTAGEFGITLYDYEPEEGDILYCHEVNEMQLTVQKLMAEQKSKKY